MTWKTIDNIEYVITKIALVLALLLLISGCTEEKQVWGNGDPPDDYIAIFGNDNTARLNKAQNDLINRHDALFFGVDTEQGHQPGLIDFFNILQARVTKLEVVDPNEIPDINARLDKLETVVAEELVEHGDLLFKTAKRMIAVDNPIEGHLRWVKDNPQWVWQDKGHLEFYDGKCWIKVKD